MKIGAWTPPSEALKRHKKVISIQDQKSQDREHHLGPGMQNSTLQKTVLV